jgi:hypothetical protein
MGSLALGAAFAGVQLVYKAYSKAKTSKARCARLVERCQLVVDRLERIATARDGDVVIRERIHELEWCVERPSLSRAEIDGEVIISISGLSNILRRPSSRLASRVSSLPSCGPRIMPCESNRATKLLLNSYLSLPYVNLFIYSPPSPDTRSTLVGRVSRCTPMAERLGCCSQA